MNNLRIAEQIKELLYIHDKNKNVGLTNVRFIIEFVCTS